MIRDAFPFRDDQALDYAVAVSNEHGVVDAAR